MEKPKFNTKDSPQDSYHVCEKCGKAVRYGEIRDAYDDGSYAVCIECYGKYYHKKRKWKVEETIPYQDKAYELLKEFNEENPENEYKIVMEYGAIHDPMRPLFKIMSRPKNEGKKP